LRSRQSRIKAGHPLGGLQRILRADQPPHKIELQLTQRQFARIEMPAMWRIERTAEQPDAHSRRQLLRVSDPRRHQGRVCPAPRTTYLNVVSCSTPTGPRACSLPVPMPISAPIPNSPPSANWVDALCITIAESNPVMNRSAAERSPVIIASVCCEP